MNPESMPTEKILKKYKFKRVGRFFLRKKQFIIEIEDKRTTDLGKTIYIFVTGKEIARIGSSKGILRHRFRAWERDVTSRLRGRNSSTLLWEAKAWQKLLKQHGEGVIFARQGTKVQTPVGTIHTYLDEESVLIGRHLPPLNRSKHR